MPLLILFHLISSLVFDLFYIVVLNTYDLAPSLIDCPPNALVFDRTGFKCSFRVSQGTCGVRKTCTGVSERQRQGAVIR